jgi:AbrB family looped-hinge helix DNA binding protein
VTKFLVRCLTIVLRCGKIPSMRSYPTIISSKGQVVIPAELREQYGLDKGTRATWTEDEGRLVLTPMTMRRIKEIRGFLKPRPGEPSAFDGIFEERESERKREDR